jgi:hypothetical protein
MILLKKIKKNNLYLGVPFFSEKGVIGVRRKIKIIYFNLLSFTRLKKIIKVKGVLTELRDILFFSYL